MKILIDTNVLLDVLCNRADFIVTRNVKDFKNSPVPAITPAEFLEQFDF